MKPFTAQIIYRIECEGMPTDQYEEQWRLVYAEDENAALEESKKISKEAESIFIDRYGRTIYWRLLAVKDLQPVEVKNGSLLFSTIREAATVASPLWTNN